MLGDILGSLAGAPDADTCSRAGCSAAAKHRVVWRNPRIHTAERQKVWLACDEHVGYLRDFLAARDFPVRVEAHDSVRTEPHPPTDVSESD
ncbi:hypothetical protein [Microbacterium nymphoidis]|uniref:hypothetical protein n=1 Tax=Microbacterium nymphoidis TaxID=2898586 RepID=UPI001E494EA2|nr:hypothetical protein [Microbacterium nymphoidis]MCD2497313.1 hypothetical protein [Microbacterium nymphoidis]